MTDDRCQDPDALKQPSNRTVASQVTVWTTATSGRLRGGMIGNALDKGAGYGPYFDHFGFSCGMEVVLGTGALIRNGAIAPGRYGIY